MKLSWSELMEWCLIVRIDVVSLFCNIWTGWNTSSSFTELNGHKIITRLPCSLIPFQLNWYLQLGFILNAKSRIPIKERFRPWQLKNSMLVTKPVPSVNFALFSGFQVFLQKKVGLRQHFITVLVFYEMTISLCDLLEWCLIVETDFTTLFPNSPAQTPQIALQSQMITKQWNDCHFSSFHCSSTDTNSA